MNDKKKPSAEQDFFLCESCGNIVIKLEDSGITPHCCDKPMKKLVPGTKDELAEKHVPIWCIEGNKLIVAVGSEPHPMEPEHHIRWIFVKTNRGFMVRNFIPNTEIRACFKLGKDESVEAVYAFCNLHNLWKAEEEECC